MRILFVLILLSLLLPLAQAKTEAEIEATYIGHGIAITDWDAVFADELLVDEQGNIPLYAQLWHYDDDGQADRGEALIEQWVCAGVLTPIKNAGCTPYNYLHPLEAAPVVIHWKDHDPLIDSAATLLYANVDLDVAVLALSTELEEPGDPLADLAVISALYAANEEIESDALTAVLAEADIPAATEGTDSMGDDFAPELGNGGIDVVHYDLNLAIDMEALSIEHGTATLQIRAIQPNLAAFTLDLRQLNVSAVTVNDQIVEYEQLSRKLHITLPEPKYYGERFTVAIQYSGILKPVASFYMPFGEMGATANQDSTAVAMLSEPDAANTWFPANDHPLDPATFRITVVVEPPFKVVSNGQLVAADEGSFTWAMPDLMASYLATIAIADYALIEDTAPNGIPLRHFVYADSDRAGMTQLFSGTGQAMSTLEEWFGAYPFASYGHVITPMLGGALETQTMTSMPDLDANIPEENIWFLVVHELTHQWFGNNIRLGSWQDIWLNEGFATYAEWIAYDARFGMGISVDMRSDSETVLIESNRSTPLSAPQPNQLFSTESYDKGGWVLHMLGVELGDELWRETLKAYVEAFADDNVTTNEFFQFIEQYTGRDLTTFRQQWVEQAGVPDYTLYWQSAGRTLNIRVCSNDPDQRYSLMLPLNIRGDVPNSLLTTLYMTPDESEFSLDLEFVAKGIQFDPLQSVLDNMQVEEVDELPACE